MGKSRFYIFAGIFAVLIFAIVLFLSLTDQTNQPLPSNVKVSFTTPVETPAPTNYMSEEKKKADRLTPVDVPAASTVNPASSQIEEPSTITDISQPDARFVLHIQDAMGEPIASGVIFAGTKEYKFTKGDLSVTDSWTAGIPVTVSAEGYAPIEKVINPDDTSTHTIAMEYVSSYQIAVGLIDSDTAAQNCSVRIWKGDIPERPVRDDVAIVTKSCYGFKKTRFGLQQKECRVTQGLLAFSPHEKNFDQFNVGYALTGDVLLALGNCVWSTNPMPDLNIQSKTVPEWSDFVPIHAAQSSKLRIWDAMYLAQQKEVNSINLSNEKCIVQRDTRTGSYFLAFPDLPADSKIVCELKTDTNGRCRIDNLPPALYYVQAYKDDQTSLIVPMHPACGGANLRMYNRSRVSVEVKREGLEYKDYNRSCVDGAEVLLKSSEGQSGFYSASTDYGRVEFRNVPYGKYHLSVNPPDGQRFEKDIRIQKPEERIDVSISGWEKYAVTGIVIDADTEKPINNYELILEGMSTTDAVKTGEDGRFVFPDIQVGAYRISIDLTNSNNAKYLWDIAYLVKDNETLLPLKKAAVPGPGPKYENVEIRLYKSLETLFSGTAVTQDKKPIAGAEITVSFEEAKDKNFKWKLLTIPAAPVTDQNGHFSVKVICGPKTRAEQGTFEITAIEGMSKAPDYNPDTKFFDIQRSYAEANNIGSLALEGKPGQTFDNLQIVLKGKNDGILHGRVITEEENLNEVGIIAVQNTFKMGRDIPSNNDSNKNFTISNIAPGNFELHIYPGWKTEVETPFDIKTIHKYLDEKIILRMPENQKEMYVDVTLRHNGYLMGYAGIAGGDPFRFVNVEAINDNDAHLVIDGKETNHKGFFFVDGLTPGEFYHFRFFNYNEKKEIYRSEPFNPGTDEIKIEMKQ